MYQWAAVFADPSTQKPVCRQFPKRGISLEIPDDLPA
jgi:hypothetical protein